MAVRRNPNIVGQKQQKILLYTYDIFLTPTDPITFLTKCITEFGLIFGYMVNFDKSNNACEQQCTIIDFI